MADGFVPDPDPPSHRSACRHVSRVVARTPQEVYAFLADPRNLPRWASGLARGEVWVETSAEGSDEGGTVRVESPMGAVRVRFAARNAWGVLDHDVELPSGETVTNPMRVLPHPDGAEVVFTVRQLGLTDAEFERDAATVADDLSRLQQLLEGPIEEPPGP